MLIELTTRKDLPIYSYFVTLEGTQYQLSFRWNTRIDNNNGKWFVSIADQTGDVIVNWVPIVATWPLFSRFKDSRLPPGIVTAYDSSGQNIDPGRFDLGDRVRMLYQESTP